MGQTCRHDLVIHRGRLPSQQFQLVSDGRAVLSEQGFTLDVRIRDGAPLEQTGQIRGQVRVCGFTGEYVEQRLDRGRRVRQIEILGVARTQPSPFG